MIEPKYIQEDVNGNQLSEAGKEWCDTHQIKHQSSGSYNWKLGSSRDGWKEDLFTVRRELMTVGLDELVDDSRDRKILSLTIPPGETYGRFKQTASEYDVIFEEANRRNGSGNNMVSIIVSTNQDLIDQTQELESGRNDIETHRELGELYGVPSCCIDFFTEVVVKKGMKNPLYEITANTEQTEIIEGDRQSLRVPDPDPLNNILYQNYGWSFIDHIPCSWDCEESKDIAEYRGEVLANRGFQDEANRLWEWLRLPGIWTGLKTLGHIRNEYMTGEFNTSCYWSEKKVVWKEEHEPGGEIISEGKQTK